MSRVLSLGLLLSVMWLGCARGPGYDPEIERDWNAGGPASDGGAAGEVLMDDGPPGPTVVEVSADPASVPDGDETIGGEVIEQTLPTGVYHARTVYQQRQHISGDVLLIRQEGTLLNTNTIYSVVRLEADGRWVEDVCGVDILSQDGDGSSALFESTITISAKVFENMPPWERVIEWEGDQFTVPFAVQPVGWELAGDDDVIPTSAADARVFDADQDGHPGITVSISENFFASGDLYAVQLMRNTLSGRLVGDDLTGQVTDTSQQEVLGGTVLETEQSVEPAGDATTNVVDLVKTSEDAVFTCPQLLADPRDVFPPHPVASSP